MTKAFRAVANGVRLAVRVTPRAKASALAGIFEGPEGQPALGVRLAARPVDGAANKALIAFVAKELNLPRSAIRISAGETSRFKTLLLSGDPEGLIDRLCNWIEPASGEGPG